MDKFIEALKSGKGFEYMSSYENCADLTREDMRMIIKEMIYAIESRSVGLLESEVSDIYNELSDNLY